MGVGVANLVLILIAAGAISAQAPKISSVSPSTGLVTGTSLVTVVGTGFQLGTTKCKFGETLISNGVYDRQKSQVVCAVPAATFTGPTVISVSTDNGASYSNTLSFKYVGVTPVVTSISPNISTPSGGTTITVTGSFFTLGFSPKCQFGTVNVDAKIWGPEKATCVSPTFPSVEQTIDFRFTNDGLSSSSPVPLIIAVPIPILVTINPSRGFLGTKVVLNGNNLLNTNTGVCQFGGSLVRATRVSSVSPDDPFPYRIECIVPTLNNTRNKPKVEVRYSNDGTHFSNPLSFTYVGVAPTITSVTPASAAFDVATNVTITGSHFAAGAALQCLFGSYDPVPATILPNSLSGSVVCTTPVIGVQMDLRLQVTNSGSSLVSNSLPFSFKRQSLITEEIKNPEVPPTLSDIYPTYGDVNGGEKITITGTGFIDDSRLSCAFGVDASAVVVPAQLVVFRNNQRITCVAPASPGLQPFLSVVSVSNDKITYSNPLLFRYVVAPPSWS